MLQTATILSTENETYDETKLSTKEYVKPTAQWRLRYSGEHLVILHLAKSIEPLFPLFRWAEISVELQSSYLDEADKTLRLL